MLPTINFQYQSRFQTNKIRNVFSERMLPAEFVTFKLFHAQVPPEQLSPHRSCHGADDGHYVLSLPLSVSSDS